MDNEEVHPIEKQIEEIDAAKKAAQKPSSILTYSPSLHDGFIQESVKPWNLEDIVRDSLRPSKLNLVLGATHPVANDQYTSVTWDYLSIQGLGLANGSLLIASESNGENALDTGSVAADTWYAVFVIATSRAEKVAGLLSLSTTAPTLPAGYSVFRRVGWIRTGAGAKPYCFYHVGDWIHWNEALDAAPFRVLNAGHDTAFAAGGTSCAAVAPATCREVLLNVYVECGTGVRPATYVRPHGSTRVNDNGTVVGSAGGDWATGNYISGTGIRMITDSSQKIGYMNIVANLNTSIFVTAFHDPV